MHVRYTIAAIHPPHVDNTLHNIGRYSQPHEKLDPAGNEGHVKDTGKLHPAGAFPFAARQLAGPHFFSPFEAIYWY
jgi:hypothetical protein